MKTRNIQVYGRCACLIKVPHPCRYLRVPHHNPVFFSRKSIVSVRSLHKLFNHLLLRTVFVSNSAISILAFLNLYPRCVCFDMAGPKRQCRCGCRKEVSARTELRHRSGQAPARIRAAQIRTDAARTLAKHIRKTVSSTASHASGIIQAAVSTLTGRPQQTGESTSLQHVEYPDNGLCGPEDEDFDMASAMSVDRPHSPPPGPAEFGPPSDQAGFQNGDSWAPPLWQPARMADESDSEDEEEGGYDEGDSSSEDLFPLGDDDDDSSSIGDEIEAEWEKEWAELGE